MPSSPSQLQARRRPAHRGGPLRVLFPYDGSTFGGSHVSSLLLAASLKSHGHDPMIVVHGPGRVAEEAEAAGLPVAVLPGLWGEQPPRGKDRARIEHVLAWAGALRRLRESRPHLVHVNDLAMLRVWGPPARMAGTPLVKHWRSSYRPSATIDLGLRCASSILVVSQGACDALPGWARRKAVVEYNPIAPPSLASPDDRGLAKAALGLPREALLVGVFGALSRRKRPFVLAEVLGQLGSTLGGRPLYGVAAGEAFDASDRRLDAAIETYGLHDRLIRPGFVQPVRGWMAACDLVLAPAVDEPFGRTPLEAMACGAPVVVSEGCGAVEVLTAGHDAMILPPEPVEAWTRTAERLLTDQALSAGLVRNGYETVQRFHPQDHARRVAAHYHLLLSGAKRPGAAP